MGFTNNKEQPEKDPDEDGSLSFSIIYFFLGIAMMAMFLSPFSHGKLEEQIPGNETVTIDSGSIVEGE